MSMQTNFREISDPAVMSVQPLVSVLMLAYRHERFIADAIEGVVSQVCDFPFELIVAEDCSPDDTLKVALDYQKRYPHIVRVLTGSKNVGMHANAARFDATTRGKYLAGCEGDDFWHDTRKLQMQVDLMSANPGMAACHTDHNRQKRYRTTHYKHRRDGHAARWLEHGTTYRDLLRHWVIVMATVMVRRDIYVSFQQSEYNNPDWPFGDYGLLLYSSLHGGIGYIDEATATYRKVGGSSTNASYGARLRMIVATLACVDFFIGKHPIPEEEARCIRGQLEKRVYRAAFYADDKALMCSCHQWLKENSFKRNEWMHQVRLVLIDWKTPMRMYKAFKNFVSRCLHTIPG